MSPEQKQDILDSLKDINVQAEDARVAMQGFDGDNADNVRTASFNIDGFVEDIKKVLAKL